MGKTSHEDKALKNILQGKKVEKKIQVGGYDKEFSEKKNIITQAKINNIRCEQFSNFREKINKKAAILINIGGIKIFKEKFLDKFYICINYILYIKLRIFFCKSD